MNNKSIKKKNVLLTGAAKGIGKEIFKTLAKNYNLLVLDKNKVELLETVNELKITYPYCAIYPYVCDISNSQEVEKVINCICKDAMTPDILVNNAGYGGPFNLLTAVSDQEWEDVIFTNLKGVFNLCRAILPFMQQKQWGRIINIASIQGIFGAPLSSTYVASKHGVIGYTKAISAEWAQFGITCNAICPGYVNTNMGAQNDKIDNHMQKIINRTPAKRLAQPIEIALLVKYLISDDSGFINGSIITIDGGISADIGIT